MRIGVLNNLRAGRSRRQVTRIVEFLRAYPGVSHVETPTGEVVPDALSRFARDGVDVLVVQGGDGTLARVLTEVLEHGAFYEPPMIAPLRGGRTNMTALDVGTQRDPVRALATLFQSIRNGSLASRVVTRPVIRMEIPHEGFVQHGMFFGVGVIHRAIELVHESFPRGRSQGVFGAGIVTSALVARAALVGAKGILDPDKIQIKLDGTPHPTDAFQLVIASTLDRLFLRMRPFWGIEPAPLRLTAISAGAQGARSAAPGILRGRPRPHVVPENGYTSLNVHRAELLLDCGFTVDGEMWAGESGRRIRLTADQTVDFVRL
jgi:hypothetical protein